MQAPKPEMFSGFWQLVVDQKVSLIVMITKLVENEMKKADQYWPNEVGISMELGSGTELVIRMNTEVEKDHIISREFTVNSQGWLSFGLVFFLFTLNLGFLILFLVHSTTAKF